jgi:alpha-methylacyl-CoA racemase
MECSRARPTDPPLAGPLQGLKFIEIASIGPGPFCGMMLADHGGEVIRIERIDAASTRPRDAANILNRSRRNIRLDLKTSEGVTVLLDLAARADGLIEGFRPGVMERLGIGPEILLHHNPKLVYGRMTGWGQTGPYKSLAGHDINYLALSGVLDLLGREGQKPTPPINLLGDFGGGGMLLAFGMLAAILHARGSGQGQVVDCSMGEGSALLSSMIWGLRAQQRWRAPRGNNLLDTGAHFYEVYACADGRHIAVGALEPQFYAELRRRLGLSDDAAFDDPHDDTRWPGLKERLAAIFMTRDRAHWCSVFDNVDACFAPVLSPMLHPHNQARQSFISLGGVPQPAPAPRWSATPAATPRPPSDADSATDVLRQIGYEPAHIQALRDRRIVG